MLYFRVCHGSVDGELRHPHSYGKPHQKKRDCKPFQKTQARHQMWFQNSEEFRGAIGVVLNDLYKISASLKKISFWCVVVYGKNGSLPAVPRWLRYGAIHILRGFNTHNTTQLDRAIRYRIVRIILRPWGLSGGTNAALFYHALCRNLESIYLTAAYDYQEMLDPQPTFIHFVHQPDWEAGWWRASYPRRFIPGQLTNWRWYSEEPSSRRPRGAWLQAAVLWYTYWQQSGGNVPCSGCCLIIQLGPQT